MRPEVILHWTAHTLGVASTLLLLAFAFGGREHLRFTVGEAIVFLLFPVGVMAGFAVAWWRELAGGLVTVGSLALFALFMFAYNGRWLGPYFLLFAAPGFLHVVSALLAARGRDSTTANTSGSWADHGEGNAEPGSSPDPARDGGSRIS